MEFQWVPLDFPNQIQSNTMKISMKISRTSNENQWDSMEFQWDPLDFPNQIQSNPMKNKHENLTNI